MAQAIIGGLTYQIAPFRLRELRRAAPFIDAIAAKAQAGAPSDVRGVAQTAFDMLCVLAVGIEGATAESLEQAASLEELSGLRATFDRVLEEAGLNRPGESQPGRPKPGELQAGELPSRQGAPATSSDASTPSSPTSSPPDAATGTA